MNAVDKGIGALDALYREVILDHHRSPRNFGKLSAPTVTTEGFNPLCGDRIEIYLQVKDGTISACNFGGEGCSICMASASMMTEEMIAKSPADALLLISAFRKLLKGEQCPLSIEGDLESLVGVRQFPVRIKCALLPWTTLNESIEKAVEGLK
jgi:nitrogen fixation protein NifU and related proteins